MLTIFNRKHPCAWKGLLGGLAGGLIATIAMTQFQNGWKKVSHRLKSNQNGQGNNHQNGSAQAKSEDATMKAAGEVARVAGYPLSHDQKKKASPVVHYGFGTIMGGM